MYGVGLGLRYDFFDEVIEALENDPARLAPITFFEAAPENYMRRGGWWSSAFEWIRERVPVFAHGLSLSVGGLDPIDPSYIQELSRFLKRIDPPLYSDHLCFSTAKGRVLHDLLPLPLSRASARHAAKRAKETMDRLERKMALENITHYLVPGAPTLDEAEFLGDVLDASGADLLLDVNNVYVNAVNYGFDPRAFLEKLPLDRVACFHVAGHFASKEEALLIDSHGAEVIDPVLDLLSFAVARTGDKPVVLERDHHIPELDVLLEEAKKIAAAIERGLAEKRPVEAPRKRIASVGATEDFARDEALLTLVERVVTDPAAEKIIAEDPRAFFRAAGVAAEDREALSALPSKRLLLYRRLVRSGIRSAVRMEIPRAAARLGATFDESVDAWLDDAMPSSHVLRDAAFEFVAWAAPRLERDDRVAPYLVDLAKHELSLFDVGCEHRSAGATGEELALDRGALFHPTARLGRYAFAVHRLLADEDARDLPEATPTALFAYRDEEHAVRYLELTPLAAAVVERLMNGATLRAAIVLGAAAVGLAVDDALLASAGTVLQDLASRGALLGASEARG